MIYKIWIKLKILIGLIRNKKLNKITKKRCMILYKKGIALDLIKVCGDII